MPRKPRIEISGYYHIVNRGVEQRIIYKEHKDYEYFIELLRKGTKEFQINLHNYCLMSNHYHLLIEINKQNLSKFMRYVNLQYALYFNKKYKRLGHLWQGRFKSYYVADEAYLYALVRYVEYNALKIRKVKQLEDYLYSSYRHLVDTKLPPFLQYSWIRQQYEKREDLKVFFTIPADEDDLRKLRTTTNLLEVPAKKEALDEKKLIKLFKKFKNTEERNNQILQAYQEGYSQYKIAKVIGISQPAVNGVMKRSKD